MSNTKPWSYPTIKKIKTRRKHIKEAGIYDITNERYHEQTDWFSSTQLKNHLPEHYAPAKGVTALNFGTFLHTVVLEPRVVRRRYEVLDPVKVGLTADGKPARSPKATAAWRDAVAKVEASGKEVVSPEEWEAAQAMKQALQDHPVASQLLFEEGGDNELSVFVHDEYNRPHKARFDRIVNGGLIDLKTTASKPGLENLNRAIMNYGYDVSAAHYMEVAQLADLDVEAFVLVFIDKEEPYRVSVVEMGEGFLEQGHRLRERALERATDPSVEQYEGEHGFMVANPPHWRQRNLDQADQR